jgi:polyisoprenoid-binding protein YceI
VALLRYTVDPSKSSIVVHARSSVHDTDARWTRLSGLVTVDPAAPGQGAEARVVVDMREFDAGDRMKNWKLRGDIEPDKYPEAVFTLARLEDVRTGGAAERFEAAAIGSIAWRGKVAQVKATGGALIAADRISATCKFELNVTHLGVKPPKVLMFKVDEVVLVEVTLEARAAG